MLWLAAVVSVIVALARPLWGTEVVVKVLEGVQVVVALDVSNSMLAEDIKPNRLMRAKLTVEELLDRLGGNDVGLVVFSGAAFLQFPLTADLHTARTFLDAASPESISRPGTALEEAIRVAAASFIEQQASRRVIMLLTDGEGHEGDPIAAARDAAAEDVVIHTIGFGAPEGEPIPIRNASGQVVGYKKNAEGETVVSGLDEVTLQQIARETGGIYARAGSGDGEMDAFLKAIAALETGEREEEFETHGVERLSWFAAAALVALVAESLLSDRRRGPVGK